MTALALAERLLAAGIPVIVVREDKPPVGWNTLTADQCDVSSYRPGKDALAVVGGHGIDLVDVDSKDGKLGSVDHLPPFKWFGVTRTPSGGAHYVVPSCGLGKISPLRTPVGYVGDYVGGRTDGSGRMFAFLPGSTRPKYPNGGYVEEEQWDVEACLAADPDPELLEALENTGGAREPRTGAYVDRGPVRNPALGPDPYAARAVEDELARLDACEMMEWDGPPWDSTTYEVACNLIEFGNSGWSGYDLEELKATFLERAPTDESFGTNQHEAKWDSALNRVGHGGRRRPVRSTPADDFCPVVDKEPRTSRFGRMSMAELLDPNRPPREYVLEPMIAAGTSVAFVAPAGHRKSLLLLGIALAVARGDDEFAGMTIPKARRVFYLDMENTEDDLRERLLSFGVTPDDDLSRFILVSLPRMEPLDSAKGGSELLDELDAYELEPGDLIVLDSYQRVTQAGENDSDTTRGYYRHTGMHLKARGLTVIRTDNTGKDASKGARGSSGKRDDVDVEYLLASDGDYIDVKTGKVRQRGVSSMSIFVTTDDAGRTRFKSDAASPAKSRLIPCVELLDELGEPDDASQRMADDAIRRSGHKIARTTIRDAVEFRKNRAREAGREFRDT